MRRFWAWLTRQSYCRLEQYKFDCGHIIVSGTVHITCSQLEPFNRVVVGCETNGWKVVVKDVRG